MIFLYYLDLFGRFLHVSTSKELGSIAVEATLLVGMGHPRRQLLQQRATPAANLDGAGALGERSVGL